MILPGNVGDFTFGNWVCPTTGRVPKWMTIRSWEKNKPVRHLKGSDKPKGTGLNAGQVLGGAV